MGLHIHQWKRVGVYQIPARQVYSAETLSKPPTGTVDYASYVCEICGEQRSEEVLYSYRDSANIGRKK